MTKFNVGIVGYGWAATAHIAGINAAGLGQVTAICSSRNLDAGELTRGGSKSKFLSITPINSYRVVWLEAETQRIIWVGVQFVNRDRCLRRRPGRMEGSLQRSGWFCSTSRNALPHLSWWTRKMATQS